MMFFVNGEFALTWTSSGETAGFEYVPLVARKVHHIELRGVLSRTEWINIAEVTSPSLERVLKPCGVIHTFLLTFSPEHRSWSTNLVDIWKALFYTRGA